MREAGYYWIKIYENSEWEISSYSDGTFAIFYTEFAYYNDNELFEIDEKRIVK